MKKRTQQTQNKTANAQQPPVQHEQLQQRIQQKLQQRPEAQPSSDVQYAGGQPPQKKLAMCKLEPDSPKEVEVEPDAGAAIVAQQTSPEEAPGAKKRKKNMGATAGGNPATGMAPSGISKQPAPSARMRPGAGIAWAISVARRELEAISSVEGVQACLGQFPECVLLSGVAARRELLSSLLGEYAHSSAAAAALVSPSCRQPVALELRAASSPQALDLCTSDGSPSPDADSWLQQVTQLMVSAQGNKLRIDPMHLRLSALKCANVDLIELPERGGGGQNTKADARFEEIRSKYLGAQPNILVCLEPGMPLDLCRRFDPRLDRTVLLGAACQGNGEGEQAMSPSELFGPAAAQALERRFELVCSERLPHWLQGLSMLDLKLTQQHKEAQLVSSEEDSDGVLRKARAAGLSFGRALQHVIGGTPGCEAGALTLEEELVAFADAAARGGAGSGGKLSARDAAEAAADLWAPFGGVQNYAEYLRETVCIPSSHERLNGGAAWQRLLSEIEVAMRLAHPPAEELSGLPLAAIQAGGTGVHGHQRWDDVTMKLLVGIAFEPLRKRIRYIAARVAWSLRQQKVAVAEWMATLQEGPSSRFFSSLFPQHLALLRSSPLTRDLVFGAFDQASGNVADQLLATLECTLLAGCLNPGIILRSPTQADIEPSPAATPPSQTGSHSGRSGAGGASAAERRSRVRDEMRRRSSATGGLPPQLCDRVFQPKEAMQALPFVERELRRAFSVFSHTLANQCVALADTTLKSLCARHIEETMEKIDFNSEQKRAITQRHTELREKAEKVEEQLGAVRRSAGALRNAAMGGNGMLGRGGC